MDLAEDQIPHRCNEQHINNCLLLHVVNALSRVEGFLSQSNVMKRPQQKPTLTNETMPSTQQAPVEYLPPKSDTIRALARTVCEELASRIPDPRFREADVIRGLADFLELAARVQAKHLNAQQDVDTDEK